MFKKGRGEQRERKTIGKKKRKNKNKKLERECAKRIHIKKRKTKKKVERGFLCAPRTTKVSNKNFTFVKTDKREVRRKGRGHPQLNGAGLMILFF